MPFLNGVYITTPGVVVKLDDSALLEPVSIAGLGLLLIGSATDGEPNTPLVLNGAADAVDQLKGGDGLQAALLAFNPSNEVSGPSQITFIRPEAATQATDDIGVAIDLTTISYGTLANLAKWKVEAGTVENFKVSLGSDHVGPGGKLYPTVVGDNVGLDVIKVYYSGSGTTPIATVTDSNLTLTATEGGYVTGHTVSFTATKTVQQVVNEINQLTGWVATLLDPNANDLALNLFDNFTGSSVGTTAETALTFTADVTAIVRWINATGAYFTAERTAAAATVPVSSSWAYPTGGTAPAATNSDWQVAYTTAQSVENIQVVTPISSSSTIWAMNATHCAYMQGLNKWRRGYVGDAVSQSLATEKTKVAALNSSVTSLVWPGSKGYDYDGNLATFAPYLVAAQVSGLRVASIPPNKCTAVSIISLGLETTLSPANISDANANGIACLRTTSLGTVDITWDRTTWLQDTKFDKVENLSGIAAGMVVGTQNAVLDKYRGYPVTENELGHIKAALLGDLDTHFKNGILAVQPTLDDISISASGNTISAIANVYIIVPGNYIGLTLNAFAYSGAA